MKLHDHLNTASALAARLDRDPITASQIKEYISVERILDLLDLGTLEVSPEQFAAALETHEWTDDEYDDVLRDMPERLVIEAVVINIPEDVMAEAYKRARNERPIAASLRKTRSGP